MIVNVKIKEYIKKLKYYINQMKNKYFIYALIFIKVSDINGRN